MNCALSLPSSVFGERDVHVLYRNHRGEVSWRRIRPYMLEFGSTEHHPTPQYLLPAWDLDKNARRVFALADVWHWTADTLDEERRNHIRRLAEEAHGCT